MSSIVASIISFSTRSSSSADRARSRLLIIMDSIFAIGMGLALRAFVSFVTQNNQRTTGTLIGLWEGVVLMHFLRKMPRSFDPYVAYGVRLFVDFLFTESLARMALVLLWTGMGMVLADVSPIFWYDMGLRKVWHHFRRDLHVITRSLQRLVPFFPKTTTSRVRFHERTPSSRISHVSSAVTHSVAPTTLSTSTNVTITSATPTSPQSTPTPNILPSRSAPTPGPSRKRHVPGYFPGYASETETDRGSALGPPRSTASSTVSDTTATPRLGTAHSTLHSVPEDLLLTPTSSSLTTEDSDTPQLPEHADIPDIDTIQEEIPVEAKKEESTPKQQFMVFPPTPADTLRSIDVSRTIEDRELPPLSATLPVIPDQGEWEFGESWNDTWEKIDVNDAFDPSKMDLPLTPADVAAAGQSRSANAGTRPTNPSTPAPIPVPEPHPSTVPRQESRSRPRSLDDVYGPEADDIPPNPTQTQDLMDLDHDVDGSPLEDTGPRQTEDTGQRPVENATAVMQQAGTEGESQNRQNTETEEQPQVPPATTRSPENEEPPTYESATASGANINDPTPEPDDADAVITAVPPAQSAVDTTPTPAIQPAASTTAPPAAPPADDTTASPAAPPADGTTATPAAPPADDTTATPASPPAAPPAADTTTARTTQPEAGGTQPLPAAKSTAGSKAPSNTTSKVPSVSASRQATPPPSRPSSPAASNVKVLSRAERISQALEFRTRAAELQKELTKLEKEQKAAAKKDSALVITKKVEVEEKQKEIEKLNKKAAKRIFAAYNPNFATEREIDLTGLDDDEPIEKVQEAIETLLRSEYNAQDFVINTGTGPSEKRKAPERKKKVINLLQELKLNFREDPINGRRVHVCLPPLTS